jgi:hypothetical protein
MNQIHEQEDNHVKSTAQRRIQEMQIYVVIRRFRVIMNQYNQESILHRDRCKKAIACELEICTYP